MTPGLAHRLPHVSETVAAEFDRLGMTERIRLVQDLWDRIAADPERVPLTQVQRAELDRRLADEQAGAPVGVPWDAVKRRALGRG